MRLTQIMPSLQTVSATFANAAPFDLFTRGMQPCHRKYAAVCMCWFRVLCMHLFTFTSCKQRQLRPEKDEHDATPMSYTATLCSSLTFYNHICVVILKI